MPRIVTPRKFVDAADHQVGQDRPRNMKSTGPAKESLEPALIEKVDGPVDKSKLDALAFNEEKVQVMVHESTDKNANQLPDLYIGGTPQRFFRGQTQVVKWKFVELLARCKETTYTQEKFQDANGTESYRQIPHTALKYPFSLVDAQPKFHARLKAVLAEG